MKLGFIGGYGHHYLRYWLKNALPEENFSVAATGDGRDKEAAHRLGAQVGATHWYEAPEQLFEEFLPDVVSIGGIYGRNGIIAAAALERGIKVVCEKPLASTWQQLDVLRQIVRDKPDSVLLTEFPFRATPCFRAARQAVLDGLVGAVALVTAQKSYRFGEKRPEWYADRELYGGTLLWVASHAIDVIPYCSGLDYARVTGAQGNLSRPEYGSMEDHCVALYTLSNGATALVHADFLKPAASTTHGDDRLRIAGSNGLVEVLEERCFLTTSTQPRTDITDSAPATPVYQELAEALRGKNHQLYSTALSLKTAEVLLQTRDAADAGEWHLAGPASQGSLPG